MLIVVIQLDCALIVLDCQLFLAGGFIGFAQAIVDIVNVGRPPDSA